MLERKYGGEKARNAALTIQRAFRRYTLLKKFDAITAMAKAERRLSRRLQENFDNEVANFEKELQDGGKCQQSRPAPLRSMSMRERRQLDSMPLPRSQSGCCELSHRSASVDYYTPTGLQPCVHHTPQSAGSYRDTTHYYTPQEAFTEANHPVSHSPYCSYSVSIFSRFRLLFFLLNRTDSYFSFLWFSVAKFTTRFVREKEHSLRTKRHSSPRTRVLVEQAGESLARELPVSS